MPNQILYTVYALLVITAIFFTYLATCAQYEAIRKYYPGLTLYEYIMLEDKLRITPRGE